MGNEAKIGLAVVGALAIMFCGVLYQRVSKLKMTPATVAKNASKSNDQSNLFGAPNKPTTVALKKGDEAGSESPDGGSFKWKSQPSDVPATTTAKPNVSSPPRAAYLPAGDEPRADYRYESRQTPPDEPANDPAVAAASNPTANAQPLEASPPVAISNPSTLAGSPADAAQPDSPAVTAIDAPTAESAALDDLASDESAAPARLDEQAVPATLAEAAPPPQAIENRPTSRFIAPPQGERVAAPETRLNSLGLRTSSSDAPPSAETIAGGKYTLGPNENFWTVSEKAYGSGGFFKALHAYNAEKHPVADELTVGDEVLVPPKSELERQFPDLCPKPGRRPAKPSYAMQASARLRADDTRYVVQEGDTLFDIARYELGKASRWAELYELNRNVIGEDIDFLRAGMELVLPGDTDEADAMTRQPGEALQR